MSITTKLLSVVDKIEGITSMLNDIYRANTDLDVVRKKDKFPVCLCYLLNDGSLEYKNFQLKETASFDILFLDKDTLDFNSLKNDEIIDKMKVYAIKFIKTLDESDLFESIYKLDYTVVRNLFDSNLSGIALTNLTIKERVGICL